MKNSFLILLLFCFSKVLFCQQDYALKPARDYTKKPAKNAAYVELGGNAGFYSLNFERTYFYRERFKMAARLGFSPQPHGHYFEQVYIIENNFIFFKNPHHIEVGIGETIQRRYNERCNTVNDYFWENLWWSIVRIGYRYQKQDDGIFCKIALTPIMMQKNDCEFNPNYFQLWAGFSIGMSF